jgi:hypothetical protein
MREIVLRNFFSGRATALELARDVLGSTKKMGPISFVVEIEDMGEEFLVTRPMLVLLCDAVLSGQLPPQELSAIGFALVASESFTWNTEDVIGDVIHDWSCPEINYQLTLENVQRFKNWLLQLEPYPAKPQLEPTSTRGGLLSRTEKKSLPKGQADKMHFSD